MNNAQKIAEWSQRIHELAVEKGWWQDGIKSRSITEVVANFHSEVSEAWEEYREGRMDLWWKHKTGATMFSSDPGYGSLDDDGSCSRKINSGWKPEGFWVEIADLCIRLMDAMEAYAWNPRSIGYDRCDDLPTLVLILHFRMGDMVVFDQFDRVFLSRRAAGSAAWIMWTVIEAARANSIDLWSLIELKHAYNQTRPIRHGGKLA